MRSIGVLEKENNIINENNNVENMIYEIKGVQIMLYSEVAKLYQVETRSINEVIIRFPNTFFFQNFIT